MNSSDEPRIPQDVMARVVGDEVVILDLATGTYFGLDGPGARFWQLLSEGRPVAAIFDILREEYEVPPETLEADLRKLIDELASKGLLKT
jgi:hypothetical protein